MTTTTATADQLAATWTELWNGSTDLATALLTDDFSIRFASPTRDIADALRGPAAFASFVTGYRAQRPDVGFVVDSAAVGGLDATGTGTFAVRWHSVHAEIPAHGGIDVFEAVGGRLRRVWSVGGAGPFTLD